MVTNYNMKDIVSFGNYVLKLNEKRSQNPEMEFEDLDITHADIENWKHEETVKSKRMVTVASPIELMPSVDECLSFKDRNGYVHRFDKEGHVIIDD